ncbi:ankyrin repeat-containing domain protein, partial [Mycena capillaripes]
MSKDYFEDLPPELILVISPSLSTASLNALALTCRPLAQDLLLWAAASKPHIIAKHLSPAHSTPPYINNRRYDWNHGTALHVAVKGGNMESAQLLLEAGANPAALVSNRHQPLHLAAMNKDLAMMKLLVEHNAPIDSNIEDDGCSENVLPSACSMAHMEMVKFLLEGGANIEYKGHYGSALGFAVHSRSLDVVNWLLEKGADATVTVPLFIEDEIGSSLPFPHNANLLYIPMGLRYPPRQDVVLELRAAMPARQRPWAPLPLNEAKKKIMAILLAHGASKETAMRTISKHVDVLAKETQYTGPEDLEVVAGMFKEAEDAIPDVLMIPQPFYLELAGTSPFPRGLDTVSVVPRLQFRVLPPPLRGSSPQNGLEMDAYGRLSGSRRADSAPPRLRYMWRKKRDGKEEEIADGSPPIVVNDVRCAWAPAIFILKKLFYMKAGCFCSVPTKKSWHSPQLDCYHSHTTHHPLRDHMALFLLIQCEAQTW